GELVGFTACVPRRVRVAGRELMAWNGADFTILPEFRTLGPALELRRQATIAITQGRADFLYAHPNSRMAAVHRRVGHQPLGEMQRWARPLSVAERIPTGGWKTPLRGIARSVIDPLLHGLLSPLLRSRGVRVAPRVEFDERFDRLFDRHAGRLEVVGVRDARYLNWRWAQESGAHAWLLLDERDSELEGFAIVTAESDHCLIRDLFPTHDSRVIRRLLVAASRLALTQRRPNISFTLLASSPLHSLLPNQLFSQRPDVSEAFVFFPPNRTDLEPVGRVTAWYLTSGDRDA
ncbi:MAG: hypothetical protein ACKOFW_14040, partial [Planctomycetaceae bacterium]